MKQVPNSEKYFFADFTHTHYRKLLKIAKRRYDFIFYDEIRKEKNEILWRHDVDFSLEEALNLATIENEEGVKSTYFFLLHNEFYNILERKASDILLQIKSLGHQIGLHFDAHYYGIDNVSDLNKHLSFEKEILNKMFNLDIKVFSFHNTTPFLMSCTDWAYSGLINTYAEYFQTEVEYCSDSNGYWKYNRLLDVLEASDERKLQILTHPEWWTDKIMSPKQKIDAIVNGRAKENLDFYDRSLKAFNNVNLDW